MLHAWQSAELKSSRGLRSSTPRLSWENLVGFSLQSLSASLLADVMKGLLCMTLGHLTLLRQWQQQLWCSRARARGPACQHRGWKEDEAWERGAQPPQTDFAKFIAAASATPFLLINPGLQPRAPSQQGRRDKGRGNKTPRETQRAALAYGMPKARKQPLQSLLENRMNSSWSF